MKKKINFKNFSIYFDQYLFISITLLSIMGLFFLYSASQEDLNTVIKQSIFVGFGLIFYFLMWRPQSKRTKEHKNLVSGLSKGDEVITNGGIAGKISKVTDDFIRVEVAEGVEIKVQKIAISASLPKGTLKSI